MKTYLARSIVFALLLVTTGCLTVQTSAQMLTFEFYGTLTEVVNDPYGVAHAWGSVGDPFWGSLSYDPTWQNSNNTQGIQSGTYMYDVGRNPAEAAITMSISTPSQTEQIGNREINPSFLAVGSSAGDDVFSCYGEYQSDFWLEFELADHTGDGTSGNFVPSNLDLNDWAAHYVNVSGLPGGGYVQGDITVIQIVPEPGVEIIMGLGIIIWSLRRPAQIQCAGH